MAKPAQPAVPAIEVGRVIAGKFRLTRQLGEGGMGSVWAAAHQTLGREVAVKFLQPQAAHSHVLTNRFVSEAQMVASIKHRFVVDVFDFGVTDDGLHYMVLELLQGRSLADRMDHGPAMSVRAAVKLMADCLRGLHVVHEAGIVHRDLKPDNIFVIEDADGAFPKLIDFGISRRADPPNLKLSSSESRKSRLTQPGVVLGTPYYMSPEQLRGKHSVDARSDIYSFGVILYELLAGRLPFRQDNIGDLMVAITVTGTPSLVELRAELGAPLSEVVARAMAPAPDKRYPDALALRQALLEVLPELPEAVMCVVQEEPGRAAGACGHPHGGAAGADCAPSGPADSDKLASSAGSADSGKLASSTETSSGRYPWSHARTRAALAVAAGLGFALMLWVLMRTATAGPEQAELHPKLRAPVAPLEHSGAGPRRAPASVEANAQLSPSAADAPAAEPDVQVEVLEPIELSAGARASGASAEHPPAAASAAPEAKPARARVRLHEGKARAPASRPRRIYRKLDF